MIPIAHGHQVAGQPQIQRVTTIAHAHLEALNLLHNCGLSVRTSPVTSIPDW